MYRNLLLTMSAAALSLGLLAAGPALAQVQLAEEVEAKLTMLGIDTTMIVTEEQLLEIEGVLNTNDSDDTKTEAIKVILAQ
jgi:hypothetical protein